MTVIGRITQFGRIHHLQLALLLVITYFLFSSTVYAVMSIVKHSHYETFSDLGINNQGVWLYSQFRFPISSYHVGRPFIADHFDPIMVTLTPLYWLFPSEKTLLFIQPFIVLSAMIPLFFIGMKLTKSMLFSFAIIFAYSLYLPLQYTIFYDFHKLIFIPPLLSFAYYFLITKQRKLLATCLILLLLTKEEVGFLVSAFGAYVFLFHKEERLLGLFFTAFGFVYSLIVMHIIIPFLGGNYLYFGYGEMGKTPGQVIVNTIQNPLKAASLFLNSPTKWETLKDTFWPFAYLPLLSPVGLILSFEQFFTRFMDQRNVIRWTIAYHYSAPMAAIVALGTIWSAAFYTHIFPKIRRPLLVALAILLIILTRIEQINRSAVLLIKRPQFWARAPWMDSLDKAISLVPKNASVATQNNISPHLSTREHIYELPNIDLADYVLVDFHPGQSGYNFWGDENKKMYQVLVNSGTASGKFKILFRENDVMLLRRA